MSSYSVRRPITVLMGILIIIVLGVFSVSKLPLTLFPDINLPYVVTITTYEGATPEEVEMNVASPIESAVSTIGNYKEVSSMSNESFGISIVTFADGANMDSVVIELRELINNIGFPEGVGSTRILRISPDMLPVMTVTLYKTYAEDLTDDEVLIRNTEWINKDVLLDLQSIPGVADVSVSGAADVVLQVNLDSALLTTYGMTHQEVLQVIEDQNVGGLVGVALDSGEIRMLYLGNKPSNLADIEALPILTFGGNVITLGDLAVTDGITYVNANTETYSKINGFQGIQISFQKQSDVGITEASNSIMTRLNEIIAREGSDTNYTVLLDQGEYINLAIGSVLQNIIIGGILAIIVLFVFLKDIKPTLIVGLAIPISVIAAFMLMYFSNVSLNLISMGGLALGIGMLVDNSIVVIENIFRMITEGKTRKEAAVEGAKQVAGAITASTLTTIAVFLPIAFIEGMVADVFISMALTISFSLGASLLIALTLVPSMASQMLNDHNNKKESKVIAKLKVWYKSSVLYTINHKTITLVTVVLLLGVSVFLVVSKGFIMLPTSDEGTLNITVDTVASVDFETNAAFADYLTTVLMDIDDVDTVSATINSSLFGMRPMMMGGSSGTIQFTINLKDSRSKSTMYYEGYFRDLLAVEEIDYLSAGGITEAQVIEVTVAAQNSTGALGGSTGVNIKVSGYDLLTLESIANDISGILEGTEHIIKVDNGVDQGSDNVRITVNNEQAMLHSLTSQDVMDNINLLYANLSSLGSTQSLTITLEGVDYTLDLPSDTISGDISFDVFGDYLTFLGGVKLFDDATRAMIDVYVENAGQGIYVPNAMLPTYVPGQPVQLIVNPYLVVTSGEIVLNPMSLDPSLTSLAIAPLFDLNNPTESVTDINRVTGFSTINTDGTNRYLNVTAQVEPGKNITLVSQDVVDRVNTYLDSDDFASYGGGYHVTYEGENENILSAVNDLVLAAIVAILLVYMVMAIQFQSLVYPLIILGTIPLAFTGGMIALLITNSNLSLVSIMGLIILIGVVVNNGIVLIDYINKLRLKGRNIIEAIVEAGQTRLRPILMTALTTILALVTMAIGVGQGAELLQPMAITAIGGLIYATLLTLVVVPTIYALVNFKKIREEAKADAIDQG
ncbi:MAG: efflux RND transporter permease subunit [Acholeplasmataceae bacterium]|nr:efflux RND transporter permease subunit [Acholeplasmataceae bacterium]